MHQKFLLYLTDEDIILYRGASEKLRASNGSFKDTQLELKNYLVQDPKARLCLLIDRNQQDIREEKIPPLLPWDRLRFLFHKKSEWAAQGGYTGFQFLKEERETYLRWIHIPANDSLSLWILWVQSLPNPFGGIFFAPLEAGNFLKKHLPHSNDYKMLIYNISSQQTRHVIFKGGRLLLSRLSQEEEDLMTSLHFLSREHPDIHEKLHVLSLVKDSLITLPQTTSLPGPQPFINFIASQKQPTLLIRLKVPSGNVWLRKGAGLAFIGALVVCGMDIYQGLNFKNESVAFLSEVDALKAQIRELNLLLRNKNVTTLRKGVEHYHHLKSYTVNPLESLEKLSFLLEKHRVRLKNFKWHHEQKLEMVLTFLMKDKIGTPLAVQFEAFLATCEEIFPASQVHVLKAPFNSSVQECFKNPSNRSLPLAQVRIVFP